jgi:hypothetical protein
MKMRFEAKCPRCRVGLTVGTFAVRQYGGYWHTACAVAYAKQRKALRKD